MNEYADLFHSDQNPDPKKKEDDRTPSEAYEATRRDQNHNKWAFLLYFLVYIVLIGAMGFYFASLYPNPDETLNRLEWVTDPSFFVQEPTEDSDVRSIVFRAALRSQNTDVIEAFQLFVTFTDANGDVLFETTLTKEYFQSLETWEIEETFFLDTTPEDVSVRGSLYVSSLTNVLFSAAQGILLIVIFFSMQWLTFKGQLRRFLENWKKNLGYIVFGIALVFAAVYVGGMLLEAFGVYDTSQNEMAIQQMFQDDPLILWLLFFTLCIAAPITEEIVFRKAIFGFVEPKWGVAPAILISSLVFGMMHVLGGGDWIQIIPYALMGMAFGYIYHLSGRNLWVVVLMHFANNFFVFLLYLPAVREFLLTFQGI
jgi:hypothetical protein